MTGFLKRKLRLALLRAARAVLRRPRLRTYVLVFLDGVPRLRELVRKAMRGSDWRPPRRAHMPRNPDDLSPATLAAYRELEKKLTRRLI